MRSVQSAGKSPHCSAWRGPGSHSGTGSPHQPGTVRKLKRRKRSRDRVTCTSTGGPVLLSAKGMADRYVRRDGYTMPGVMPVSYVAVPRRPFSHSWRAFFLMSCKQRREDARKVGMQAQTGPALIARGDRSCGTLPSRSLLHALRIFVVKNLVAARGCSGFLEVRFRLSPRPGPAPRGSGAGTYVHRPTRYSAQRWAAP